MRKEDKTKIITRHMNTKRIWIQNMDLFSSSEDNQLPSSTKCELFRSALAYDGEGSFPQHFFIRHETIMSPFELDLACDEDRLLTGVIVNGQRMPVTVPEYLRQMMSFERKRARETGHGKRIRYMEKLTVMVPLELSGSLYTVLAAKLIEIIGASELPYFVCFREIGKGKYIEIFTSERPYYEQEMILPKYAPADFWRNPVTGRRCRKDDQGAVLAYRKGDVIGQLKSHFSLCKKRLFRISPKQMSRMLQDIKETLLEFLQGRNELALPSVILPRFNSESFQRKTMKIGVIQINYFLIEAEKKLNELVAAVDLLGYDQQDHLIQRVFREFAKKILAYSRGFTVGSHRHKIRAVFDAAQRSFEDYYEWIEYVFWRDFRETAGRMVPECGIGF